MILAGGHRIRIIGYDELLQEPDFEGFPEGLLTIPGHTITTLDGEDHSDVFQAFVHAPFKDDSFGDRNDCSLAFQVSLYNGNGAGRALLMGDLSYPVIRRIFDRSKAPTLQWNALLAPHHCSKSVMYWKDDGEDDEKLKHDIVRDLGNTALGPGYVVSSSEPVPDTNDPGDNPPARQSEDTIRAHRPERVHLHSRASEREQPRAHHLRSQPERVRVRRRDRIQQVGCRRIEGGRWCRRGASNRSRVRSWH